MPAPTYVDASHNILFKLASNPDKWIADYRKSDEGDVTGYQEVGDKKARDVLKKHCRAEGRKLYMADGDGGNPISWNPKAFPKVVRIGGKPFQGSQLVHLGAQAMGLPQVKLAPGRGFTFVGLQHATGARVLRINVHPLAGATKKESSPDARYKTDAANEWADWGLGQYFLDVLAFTASELSRNPGPKKVGSFWDVVSLGGDYNAEMDRTERWYYPGAMLPSLYRDDKQANGLDHLQVTRTSDAVDGKRWSVAGNTDHRIQFVRRALREVGDFPRQK